MSTLHGLFEQLGPQHRKFLRAFALLPPYRYDLEDIVDWFQIDKKQINAFQQDLILLIKQEWISFADNHITMELPVQKYLLSIGSESVQDADELIEAFIWILRFEPGAQNIIERIKSYLPLAEHIIEHVRGRSKNFIILVNNIAVANRSLGNYKRCREYQKLAINVAEKLNELPAPELIDLYINYGEFVSHYGDINEAIVYINKGLEIYKKDPFICTIESQSAILHNSALVYHAAGLNKEALNYEEDAILLLKLISEKNKHTHTALPVAYDIKSQILYSLKQVEESFKFSEMAIALGKECLGPQHPSIGKMLSNYAGNLFNSPDIDKLKENFTRSLHLRDEGIKILENVSDINHPELGTIYLNQGVNYIMMNKCKEAYTCLLNAKPYIENYTSEDSPLRMGVVQLKMLIEAQELKSAVYKSKMEDEPGWEEEFRKFLNKQ